MKLKVIKIFKSYDDYKPEGKQYTIYSKACKVLVDGVEVFAKVKYFKQDMEFTEGMEFIEGENCESVKLDQYKWKEGDKEIDQYTIKAKKKDFQKSGGGWQKIERTEEQIHQAVLFCSNEVVNVKEILKLENSTDVISAFQSIFKYYCESVKPNEVKQEVKPDVKADEQPSFDDQTPLGSDDLHDLPLGSDDDIPF